MTTPCTALCLRLCMCVCVRVDVGQHCHIRHASRRSSPTTIPPPLSLPTRLHRHLPVVRPSVHLNIARHYVNIATHRAVMTSHWHVRSSAMIRCQRLAGLRTRDVIGDVAAAAGSRWLTSTSSQSRDWRQTTALLTAWHANAAATSKTPPSHLTVSYWLAPLVSSCNNANSIILRFSSSSSETRPVITVPR